MATATKTKSGYDPFPDPDGIPFRTTKSDQAGFKRDAWASDAQQREHFERQMRDEGLDPATGEKQSSKRSGESRTPKIPKTPVQKGLSYAKSGAKGTARVAKTGSEAAGTVGHDTSSLVKGQRPVSLSAGLLGLFGYAIGVNFLQGGWTQAKGWLGAKFLNKAYTAPAGSAGASGNATVTLQPATTTGPVGPEGAQGPTATSPVLDTDLTTI